MKIFLYGVTPENNFGGPSLMHGAREIIKQVNNRSEIVFYQSSKPVDMVIKEMDFNIYQIPYTKTFQLLKDALKYKLGIKPKTEERIRFFKEIQNSDIVANLYGINFSSNFPKGKYSYIRAVKAAIGKYSINLIAKIYGIKSVKCTASFGPIISKMDIIGAKFSVKYIFDIIYAREEESKNQLNKISSKQVFVSPDLANLMPYNISKLKEKTIGISVSHQIIRQWKSNEKYIDCMVNLIRHIHSCTDCKIVLIPNEVTPDNPYHDMHVAQEIKSLLTNEINVEILDIFNMSSKELKSYIAACEVMIASRYHSCVAALSAGVPTLVIGWHYKYDELLKLYGQNEWIISTADCTTNQLITMFEKFWSKSEENRTIINENFKSIRKSLIDAGKIMFSV